MAGRRGALTALTMVMALACEPRSGAPEPPPTRDSPTTLAPSMGLEFEYCRVGPLTPDSPFEIGEIRAAFPHLEVRETEVFEEGEPRPVIAVGDEASPDLQLEPAESGGIGRIAILTGDAVAPNGTLLAELTLAALYQAVDSLHCVGGFEETASSLLCTAGSAMQPVYVFPAPDATYAEQDVTPAQALQMIRDRPVTEVWIVWQGEAIRACKGATAVPG